MSHLRKLKAREDNFNLSGLSHFKRPEYNALFDPNMRHYFENAKTQKHLYRSGLIDTHGRVIDYDKNKSKVAILEKEFLEAEKIEERRRKEEMEMRYRVQRKRFNELERARKEEMLQKLKKDRDFNKEIVSVLRSASYLNSQSNVLSRSGSQLMEGPDSSLFNA